MKKLRNIGISVAMLAMPLIGIGTYNIATASHAFANSVCPSGQIENDNVYIQDQTAWNQHAVTFWTDGSALPGGVSNVYLSTGGQGSLNDYNICVSDLAGQDTDGVYGYVYIYNQGVLGWLWTPGSGNQFQRDDGSGQGSRAEYYFQCFTNTKGKGVFQLWSVYSFEYAIINGFNSSPGAYEEYLSTSAPTPDTQFADQYGSGTNAFCH